MMNLQETNKSSYKTRNVSHFKREEVNAKRERESETRNISSFKREKVKEKKFT